MLTCRLEDAIKYQVENGRFDIECVAQYIQNARERLRKLKGRIINFHLKDILKKGEPDSRNTVIGEGQADCAKSLRELKILGYKGPIVIDFEHDTPSLQEDMAHNVAFIKEQARQLLAQ